MLLKLSLSQNFKSFNGLRISVFNMVTMHFKCEGLIRSSNMTSESSANIPNGTKGHRASSLNFKCKCVLVPCFDNIQGHSQHQSKNNGLLLPKYESERLPEPTGGSPDVVHLIKYASLVYR